MLFNFKSFILKSFNLFIFITYFSLNIFSQSNEIDVLLRYNPDNSVDFNFSKNFPGFCYLELEVIPSVNCAKKTFNSVINIRKGSLFKLRPVSEDKPMDFTFNFKYLRGYPNPKINEDFIYLLPFENGQSFKVLKAYNIFEKYIKHQKDSSWDSNIIDFPKAVKIFAIRKGIVLSIEKTFKAFDKSDYEWTSEINKITIEHEDGTIARYLGLNKDSIDLKVGDTVFPNDYLGTLDVYQSNIYRLYFDVSYLNTNSFEKINNNTISEDSLYSNISPLFLSKDGVVKLENNKVYKSLVENDIITKEMSRRQRKKFNKNKSEL